MVSVFEIGEKVKVFIVSSMEMSSQMMQCLGIFLWCLKNVMVSYSVQYYMLMVKMNDMNYSVIFSIFCDIRVWIV